MVVSGAYWAGVTWWICTKSQVRPEHPDRNPIYTFRETRSLPSEHDCQPLRCHNMRYYCLCHRLMARKAVSSTCPSTRQSTATCSNCCQKRTCSTQLRIEGVETPKDSSWTQISRNTAPYCLFSKILSTIFMLDAGICILTDVSHGVQILLRIIMWYYKTLINFLHRTLRALKFSWLRDLSVTTVTCHCVLSMKTWCWWAIRHEKQKRDKASQPEQACKLSQFEAQTPLMIHRIDRQHLIGGTPNAEEPIDLEIERTADPGTQNMTLQPRSVLNAHATPDDIYYEPQQGVQCQMHAFNALAGRALLQGAQVSAYIEVARQEHSSLAASTGLRGFTTAAMNAYLGTFASPKIFMGGPDLQYIYCGTPKQNVLDQLPPRCDRFIVLVQKGIGMHSYSHAICIKYSHQSHAWYLIDSENAGPAFLHDDEWLQICGGIRLPYLGQSGDMFEEAHYENSDANRQETWLDLQQQPLHVSETVHRSPVTRLENEEHTQARRISRCLNTRDTTRTATNGVRKIKMKPVNNRKMKEFFRVKERTTDM